MRTKKEIKAMVAKGEKFIAQHPYSAFGTDNKKGFYIFKRLAERIMSGEKIEKLKEEMEELAEEEYKNFSDAVSWLAGEQDDFY